MLRGIINLVAEDQLSTAMGAGNLTVRTFFSKVLLCVLAGQDLSAMLRALALFQEDH